MCNLWSENTCIQKRLLSRTNLTLVCDVELKQGMEAAHQNTQLMKGKAEDTISKVNQEKN